MSDSQQSLPPFPQEALARLATAVPDPRQGLPEEMFLFLTTLTPVVNVDLLIRDRKGKILLSWRDDPSCGRGWHVPGGIVRFQERLETRLRKTALREIGCEVKFEPHPLEFVEFIRQDQKERGHFITFIYDCRLPSLWDISKQASVNGQAGFLAWHTTFPENMIPVHHYYRKYFRRSI